EGRAAYRFAGGVRPQIGDDVIHPQGGKVMIVLLATGAEHVRHRNGGHGNLAPFIFRVAGYVGGDEGHVDFLNLELTRVVPVGIGLEIHFRPIPPGPASSSYPAAGSTTGWRDRATRPRWCCPTRWGPICRCGNRKFPRSRGSFACSATTLAAMAPPSSPRLPKRLPGMAGMWSRC